jgi:hypothetical protein
MQLYLLSTQGARFGLLLRMDDYQLTFCRTL